MGFFRFDFFLLLFHSPPHSLSFYLLLAYLSIYWELIFQQKKMCFISHSNAYSDKCQNKCWMFCSVFAHKLMVDFFPSLLLANIDSGGILNGDEISDAIIIIWVHSSMEILESAEEIVRQQICISFWAFCMAVSFGVDDLLYSYFKVDNRRWLWLPFTNDDDLFTQMEKSRLTQKNNTPLSWLDDDGPTTSTQHQVDLLTVQLRDGNKQTNKQTRSILWCGE